MTWPIHFSFIFVAFERFQVRLFPGRSVRDGTIDPSRKRVRTEMTDGPRDSRFKEVMEEGK